MSIRVCDSPISLGLFLTIIGIVMTVGCGETYDDRRQISQFTRDLTAKVKAAPESAEGKAALKELIRILNGNWSFARSRACYAFDDLGPLAAPAVPHLLRAAKNGDEFVKQDAIRGLRNIGHAAAPAVDLLIEIIHSATAPPAIGGDLRTLYAIEALGNIGEPAIKAIPSLERALELKSELAVREAQKSLAKLKRLAEDDGKVEAAIE